MRATFTAKTVVAHNCENDQHTIILESCINSGANSWEILCDVSRISIVHLVSAFIKAVEIKQRQLCRHCILLSVIHASGLVQCFIMQRQ